MADKEFGVIGLGRMGGGLALQAMEEGMRVGTSGGVTGARHGACFMAGGDREAVQRVEPILLPLAVDGHAGPSGAGHFTKLVHNGIEFGMLQAIGEGMALLENYRDRLDISNVLQCGRNGSVIRSWLIDLMHKGYVREGGLDKVPPFVEDTGKVNWLVDDALMMHYGSGDASHRRGRDAAHRLA